METFVRYYSLAEADALVARLELAFEIVDELRERLRVAVERMRELGFELKVTPLTVEHMENAELRSLLRESLGLQGQIRQQLKSLEGEGVEVKHLSGLVDVKSRYHGRVVYLCWRRGETGFHFWHELEAGFEARQRIMRASDFEGLVLH